MKQKCAGTIEPFYRKQTNACCSGAAGKHFPSASENKRLNGHENFVKKFVLKHKLIDRSAAKHANTLVSFKQFWKVYLRRIDENHRSATRESFRATREDESISFSESSGNRLIGIAASDNGVNARK